MTEEKRKMSVGKKITIGFIIFFLLLTAAAYFVGVHYFSNHFMPGSMINGFNCSYMSVQETENLLAQRISAYVLSIETRNGGVESITAEQAGLVYQPDGRVKKLMKAQNRFLWFMGFHQQEVYEMAVTSVYDEGKLDESMDALYCMQQEHIIIPRDAFIQETEEGYEIAPALEGTQLNREKTRQAIAQALQNVQPKVSLEEAGCYEQPQIYENDETLIRDCEQMNRLTGVIITYDFSDRTEVVDRDILKNWLIKDGEGNYTIDRTQVAAYVDSLGYHYDTFGLSRAFRTYDGREITITGGDYGWVIDQEAETQALYEAILNGETQVREPVYLYKGWCRDENDIGYTYVEIDLTNQRMIFYKDGKPIVDTPVVTGNPNLPGCETPTGCYAVDAMKSPSVLTGEGYAAEVTYWIPFAGNVGIHDAAWRTQFGGNLYLMDGSHGCINTPYDQAALIYQNIGIGAPVVVYK